MVLVIACGLLVAVGLVGVVVPGLPGAMLVGLAVLVWAAVVGTSASWTTFAVAAALVATGWVTKYLVPGRRLRAGGVPRRTLLIGALVAVVGFFVVPVVGLPIGFVVGVYLSERVRVGRLQAWPATRSALGAVGLSLLIEFSCAFLAAVAWVVGVVVTR